MEAGEIAFDYSPENAMETSYAFSNRRAVASEIFVCPMLEYVPPSSSPAKKRKVDENNQSAQDKDAAAAAPSVSNCYIFKSRLQEYCQKTGLMTPVYETVKTGPSHEPSFKSTVIVNNVRYDSLDGFSNRKAAEQSAAEVALMEMVNSDDTISGISQPVQETGLCKNLLQEYAQKMNYAIPLYECHKEEKQGRMPTYTCVVEIGPIKYIGASASTKKEAEIKAARTAMLAIRSGSAATSDDPTGNNSSHTVVPQKRKVPDVVITTETMKKGSKGKKRRVKKQRKGSKIVNNNNNNNNNNNEVTISSETIPPHVASLKDCGDGFWRDLMDTMGACSSGVQNANS